jgi:hypothetical protein
MAEAVDTEDAGAVGRFAPHVICRGRDEGGFEAPREGKSPSLRMLGGIEAVLRCLGEERGDGVSGVESATI